MAHGDLFLLYRIQPNLTSLQWKEEVKLPGFTVGKTVMALSYKEVMKGRSMDFLGQGSSVMTLGTFLLKEFHHKAVFLPIFRV